MDMRETYEQLPVMPVKDPPAWSSLVVNGSVDGSLVLGSKDLSMMPQSMFTSDFECNDGWISPGQEWEGVAVSHILERVKLARSAQNVEFHGGMHCQVLKVEEALDPNVIVALRLNGKSLPADNGGPCRLIAGRRKGPAHVKWLQAIVVTS
jgi:DMSO/TMAO reductase YedYZ molybdopterin-dependent catalytic subunit